MARCGLGATKNNERSHFPHEWLVRFSYFRVNSDVVGLTSKRCQISATQLPDVIMRDAEQRTTRLIVVWQCLPIDGKLVIPDTPAPARHQSGWLRCQKFQKSARARAESGVQTRRKAANLADRMLELASTRKVVTGP